MQNWHRCICSIIVNRHGANQCIIDNHNQGSVTEHINRCVGGDLLDQMGIALILTMGGQSICFIVLVLVTDLNTTWGVGSCK
jgi:hypothetical protein